MAAATQRPLRRVQPRARQRYRLWSQHTRRQSGKYLDELAAHGEVAIPTRARQEQPGRQAASSAEEARGVGIVGCIYFSDVVVFACCIVLLHSEGPGGGCKGPYCISLNISLSSVYSSLGSRPQATKRTMHQPHFTLSSCWSSAWRYLLSLSMPEVQPPLLVYLQTTSVSASRAYI
jgi:hypothetical protein